MNLKQFLGWTWDKMSSSNKGVSIEEQFEINAGIMSDYKDTYKLEGDRIVTVCVYGPKEVDLAIKEQLAKLRALKSLGLLNTTFNDYQEMLKFDAGYYLTLEDHTVEDKDEDYISYMTPEGLLSEHDIKGLEVVCFGFKVG